MPRSKIVRGLALAATLLVTVTVAMACASPTPTPTPTPTATPRPTSTATPTPPPQPTAFNVQLGSEDTQQGLEIESFFPDNLTVNVGDTVVFTLKSHEPHTVTFNPPNPLPDAFAPQPDGLYANPVVFFESPAPSGPPPSSGGPAKLTAQFDGSGFVNSGFLQEMGDSFTVTFTKPGTYQFLCLLHPDSMKGTITVNPQGTAHPKAAADYDKAAADAIAKATASGKTLLDSVKAPGPVAGSDGSRTFTVYAGANNASSGVDFMRFIGGENLTIKVGDKVTFTMEKDMPGMPHTITFVSGGNEPDLILPQPQPNGPPKLLINPQVLAPSPLPPAPYNGTGYFNSGLLVAGTPGPQSYTLTFTKAGTYEYMCILHDEAGMKGTITVQP